ncbi:MAG: SpoIIE family protein phosphatase [Bryobacteraceae bacterium]|nr:SpoIIE family protein phosphatase [Bryobacteraceae bacterium]
MPAVSRTTLGLLLCLSARTLAQPVPTFQGTPLDLSAARWQYQPGDNPAWADPALDDHAWETLNGTALLRNPASGWPGIGWFRLRVYSTPATPRSAALAIVQHGASEIFLDGRLIARYGTVGATPGAETHFNPNTLPTFLVLDGRPSGHLLAVRHSCMEMRDLSAGPGRWFARQSGRPVLTAYTNRTAAYGAGFGMRLLDAASAHAEWAERSATGGLYWLNFGLLAAIALLHLLLFWFYPRERANLFFSLFAFFAAAGNLIYYRWSLGHQSVTENVAQLALNIALTQASLAALLAFLYSAFSIPVKRWFWAWLALAALYVPVSTVFVEMGEARRWYSHALLLFPVLEVARGMRRAVRDKAPGAWIVGSGLLAYTLFVFLGSVTLIRGLSANSLPPAVRHAAVLAITIAISVYLARRFARVSREEADLRVRHERERAENERRAAELEEARRLQLSMLPKSVPRFPRFELAAYMKTAAEVGGDYYDFHLAENPAALTIAVGDATGHGLKAGTMVTAAKSLFLSLAGHPDPVHILEHSSRALRLMKLRGLFMAMTVVRVEGTRLSIGNAGLPPPLVYRSRPGPWTKSPSSRSPSEPSPASTTTWKRSTCAPATPSSS